MKSLMMASTVLLLCACSGGGPEETPDKTGHAWKAQTEMINQAKGVEDLLEKSSARQQQQIDNQAQ